MAFSALPHKISHLSSLFLAVPTEIALSYHLARNGIINEVKTGCKKPAIFLHWCKLVVMATISCHPPLSGRERPILGAVTAHLVSAQLISSCLQQRADGSKKEENFLKRSKCLFYPQVCFPIQKQTFSCFR
jgi:hypothetical protein